MQHNEPSGLMSQGDVARYLNFSRTKIWRQRRSGEFPLPCEIGGQLRWRRGDIDDWLDSRPKHDPVRPPEPKPAPRDFGRLL